MHHQRKSHTTPYHAPGSTQPYPTPLYRTPLTPYPYHAPDSTQPYPAPLHRAPLTPYSLNPMPHPYHAPGSTQPHPAPLYRAPLTPYPLDPMPYPYHAPGSTQPYSASMYTAQTPAPISTPYSSWRYDPTNPSLPWTPHPVFWYSDGSIVFRIKNVGYKVHRHFFERHSSYFRDLLAYPKYSVISPLPCTIYLLDVKKVDFERLLLIFYPSSLAADDPELFTVEGWTSILILSKKWNFAELKKIATFQLRSIVSTTEKMAMSKNHNAGSPSRLLAAYRKLRTRRYSWSRTPTPTSPSTSPPPTIQDQDGPLLMANISPSIERHEIEIPPQEELSREEFARNFNTKGNPNDIIKQVPPEGWVTAAKHREIRGSPPAPYPGPQPPPLLPALYPQSNNDHPVAKFPPKIVRFPSLVKTSQQAASWYRSLSFRKKNRPVIDPVNEAGISVQNPPTSATNNKGKAGVPPPPPQSWYKKPAPSSVHTTDAKRRPVSGVESSPGFSQFELLFTPHVGTNSVKSGKEGKRLREKDSQLSVIKEETPTNDRFLTNAMRASSSRIVSTIPHPNFIGMEQKGSYEALGSSSSPMKRRHPLAIVIPNPDEPLPPPGVAYSQPGPSNLQSHDYPIPHKASQSSARTTNTSIGIEVMPPSGFAPDPVRSPPHTGRNHLSPYHVFRPTSQASSSRIIPMPSIKSLQNSGDKHLEPPPLLPIESRSGSRADNGGLDSDRSRSAASRPQSVMMSADRLVDGDGHHRSQASLNQQPQQPSSSALNLVPPIRHSTSRVSLREAGSFANGFDDGTYLDPAFYPGDRLVNGDGHHWSQASLNQQPQQPSSSALNFISPVRHSTSRVSLREAGSFANGFDDGTYLDPAFYPGEPASVVESNLDIPSRPVSRGTSSILSYDDGTYLDPAFYPMVESKDVPSRPVSRSTSSTLSYV